MLTPFTFIVAMFVTMLLVPPLMRLARRFAILDMPDARKVHAVPIPRVGGIAMVAGTITPILLWMDRPKEVMAYLAGVGVITFFGVWDDKKPLDYRLKFLGQLIAVSIVIFYGDIVINFVPFHSLSPIPHYVAVPLTAFALLGITNAINLADGLDGLAGGTTLISLASMSVLAYLASDTMLALLTMAVIGSIVGFLRYNTHPAQVFMGDAGSQFLGFSAGVFVILLTQNVAPTLSQAMPLLLLGLPILDTFAVMGQRLYERRSPFKPDRNHIHHKLLALGCDHYEAVVIIYFIQALLVTGAFVFRFDSDALNLALFGGISLAVIGFFRCTNHFGWHVRRKSLEADRDHYTRRLISRLKDSGALTRYPALIIAVIVPCYLIYAVMEIHNVPYDAAIAACSLWTGSVMMLGIRRNVPTFLVIERLLIWTAFTAIVYYKVNSRGVAVGLFSPQNAVFALLVLLLVMAYRFTRPRNFSITPMDFLVVIAVLFIPNVAGPLFPSSDLGEIAIKSVILYYAGELLVAYAGKNAWLLRGVLTVVLTVLSIRVLFGGLPVT